MPRLLTDTTTALNQDNLLPLALQYGGPLWAYDAAIINDRISQLQQFDVVRFAQKACSNIHILRLMRAAGVKVDSVSLGEIERALAAGYVAGGDEIVFTADLLDEPTLARCRTESAGECGFGGYAAPAGPGLCRASGVAARQPGFWSRSQSENQHRR